jgi:hypothetical protein
LMSVVVLRPVKASKMTLRSKLFYARCAARERRGLGSEARSKWF